MEYGIKNNGFIGFKYPNLELFIEDIQTCPKTKWDSSSRNERENGWSGAVDFESGLKIAREGYNLSKLDLSIEEVEKTDSHQGMNIEMTVSGAVVEMGAFMAGIPENMMEFPIFEDTKFVHIVMDTGEMAQVSSNVFLNKSAATAWAVDFLESNGYRVKLDVFYSNAPNNMEKHAVVVTVKNYQEPLSIGQLAGAMHPSFFRRLMFRHIEKYYSTTPWGYGRINNNKEEITKQIKSLADADEVIFLPGTGQNFGPSFDLNSLDGAKKWAEHYVKNKLTF